MEVDGQEGFDEQLYNRQTYAIGADAQKRLGKTDVLLCGMTGLGLEIAKNIILTGVRSVTLFDPENVKWGDLSSAFYYTEADVGNNRVDSCINKLQELNKYVRVSKLDKKSFTTNDIKDWKSTSVERDTDSQQVIVYIDHPTSCLKEINNFCRENGVKFISSESKGLAGCIFVDDGPEHTVFDVDGEEVKSLLVTGVTSDSESATVTIQDNARHELSDGDAVMFTDLPDLPALHNESVDTPNPIVFRVKVTSPICFILYTEGADGSLVPFDTSKMRYSRGGYVTQVKLPKKMKFDPLEQSIAHPEFLITDFAKMDAPGSLHLLFLALHEFEKLHGHLPTPHNATQAQEVLQLAKGFHNEMSSLVFDEDLIQKLAAVSSGNINPMAALLGGFTAHEVLKAASGKFTPIHQWFYFDARELLMDPPPAPETCQPVGNRYDGSVAIFGSEFQKKLATSKLFVVGSGALGCEFLKNFSMMGIGTDDSGGVVVTDMDGIEKSNLSRQFLFRTSDIGKLKSEVAAAAASAMNPEMKIKHLTEKVAPETEHIFNDDFWESLDCVVNALDNVIARLFVDAQCVHYRKPLLESGTLGSKGNVQVVIPYITESYGTKRDPPEQSIPHCTLKNFPNAIEHTIQWARDAFEGLFTNVPRDVNCYINDDNFLQQLEAEANTRQATLNGIRLAMVNERPKTFEDCIEWARKKFDAFFTNEILQLLYNFPLDRRSNEGDLFWSGPKRPPQAIVFDSNDATHRAFVTSCANLHASIYGIEGSRDAKAIADYAAKVSVEQFMPKKVHIQVEENEKVENDTTTEMTAEEIIALLPPREGQVTLSEVEFEKDDDTNHHIDFVTACSNLRARNFKIPEADRNKTKQIAGKIIPAMVTTTALVTGLVGFEILKTLRGDKKIENYKSAFLNLAIPFLTLSEPGEVPKQSYGTTAPKHWTLWDRFDVDVGRDITLKELIQWFEDNHQLEINMMSAGTSMIYSFFSKKAEVRRRMAMKVSELVREISKQEFTDTQKYIPMEVSAEYEGEDAEVPSVRYKFRF